MKKKRTITIAAFLLLFVFAAFWSYSPRHIQIVGNLPASDQNEMQNIVIHELRSTELPNLEWDDIHHLGYVFKSLNRYAALQILWIDVKDTNYVRVVVGIDRKTINSNGWDFMVQKNSLSQWEITGSAYWGIPQAKPDDFRIPPS